MAANCEPRTATTAMLSVAPHADRVEPMISPIPDRMTSGSGGPGEGQPALEQERQGDDDEPDEPRR